MKVITTEKKPIKMWLDDCEDGAIEQAKNLANLPFIHSHVALMPDCHQGYGMPIGGVIGTEGVVIPNAVGVDIGCGMLAAKLSATDINVNELKSIMGKIRASVPVGFSHRDEKCEKSEMPSINYDLPIVKNEYESARKQLGTLGGGNHFIEIQRGSDGFIWVMIHSGSRNLGYKVANHYNKVAKDINSMWYSSVDLKHDLAFLPLESEEASAYLHEMDYCLKFAYRNRLKMMGDIGDILDRMAIYTGAWHNIHHNYATMEHHGGKNVMIHRKGATRAREGEIGIIPGSQGTKSYIVRGLGNPLSFESCSHGAGRKMGRKQAKRTLDLETEKAILDSQGIVHGIRHTDDLDEAAGAYKDISQVMENQSDLVEIVVELSPLGVIKG